MLFSPGLVWGGTGWRHRFGVTVFWEEHDIHCAMRVICRHVFPGVFLEEQVGDLVNGVMAGA